MKKEFDALRAEHEDIKEENRTAELMIEYFRTYNPQKSLASVNAHLGRQMVVRK